LKISEI